MREPARASRVKRHRLLLVLRKMPPSVTRILAMRRIRLARKAKAAKHAASN
jgi:hypothetical protein